MLTPAACVRETWRQALPLLRTVGLTCPRTVSSAHTWHVLAMELNVLRLPRYVLLLWCWRTSQLKPRRGPHERSPGLRKHNHLPLSVLETRRLGEPIPTHSGTHRSGPFLVDICHSVDAQVHAGGRKCAFSPHISALPGNLLRAYAHLFSGKPILRQKHYMVPR